MTAPNALTAATFGPTYPVVLRASSSGYSDLALSRRRGTTLLHAVTFNQPRYGPMDFSYGRSSDRGATWKQLVRFRPATGRLGNAYPPVAVAATGKRVYVAYVTRTYSVSRGSAFYLNVRVNTGYGRASRWLPVRCLRVPVRRGDNFDNNTQVSLAATGSAVFISSRVGPRVTLWTSRDGGSRWTRSRIATTRQLSWNGVAGPTAVAASGSLTAVAWSRGRQALRVRISKDGGRHWSRVHETGAPGWDLALAVRNGRIVVAGSGETAYAWARQQTWTQSWENGAWRPRYDVPGSGAGVSVVLSGRGELGVAYPSVETDLDGAIVNRLLWRTSADGGRSWRDTAEVVSVVHRGDAIGDTGNDLSGKWLAGYTAARPSTGAVHVLFRIGQAVRFDPYLPLITATSYIRSST